MAYLTVSRGIIPRSVTTHERLIRLLQPCTNPETPSIRIGGQRARQAVSIGWVTAEPGQESSGSGTDVRRPRRARGKEVNE